MGYITPKDPVSGMAEWLHDRFEQSIVTAVKAGEFDEVIEEFTRQSVRKEKEMSYITPKDMDEISRLFDSPRPLKHDGPWALLHRSYLTIKDLCSIIGRELTIVGCNKCDYREWADKSPGAKCPKCGSPCYALGESKISDVLLTLQRTVEEVDCLEEKLANLKKKRDEISPQRNSK